MSYRFSAKIFCADIYIRKYIIVKLLCHRFSLLLLTMTCVEMGETGKWEKLLQHFNLACYTTVQWPGNIRGGSILTKIKTAIIIEIDMIIHIRRGAGDFNIHLADERCCCWRTIINGIWITRFRKRYSSWIQGRKLGGWGQARWRRGLQTRQRHINYIYTRNNNGYLYYCLAFAFVTRLIKQLSPGVRSLFNTSPPLRCYFYF